jgi:hypothetical protein
MKTSFPFAPEVLSQKARQNSFNQDSLSQNIIQKLHEELGRPQIE